MAGGGLVPCFSAPGILYVQSDFGELLKLQLRVVHLCQRDTINPFSDTFDVRFIPHWRNLIKSDLTFDGFDNRIFKLNRTAITIKIITIN